MNFLFNRSLYRPLSILAMTALITACASSAEKAKDDTVGVGIKSLNYSGKEVAYIAVEKPGDPNGGGGGDALNPYSGGGSTICCFSIPQKWHPDLKVVIEYQFYPETEYRKKLVNIAPYAAGKPGDIWLIVHADESVEAVVSGFGPTRDEWPGKIKGYPIASRDYKLKIWEREVAQAKADVAGYQRDIKEFSKETILKQWEYDSERDKSRSEKELKDFSGPADPKYIQHLKEDNEQGLKFFSTRLEWLLKNKP